MAEENDGIAEVLEGQLRIALSAAAQLGTRFARLREELARNQQATTERQSRELRARFDAERSAARAELAPVHDRSWWDAASVEQIASVHETATAWQGIDEDADRARDRIAAEVRERYGIVVADIGASPSSVQEAIAAAERARADAAAQRGESVADVAEAGAFLAAAESMERRGEELEQRAGDRLDEDPERATVEAAQYDDTSVSLERDAAARRGDSDEAFDSAERRERFASSLEGKADQNVIDARLTADADQARHPREAVMGTAKRGAKARKAAAGPAQQRERNLSR